MLLGTLHCSCLEHRFLFLKVIQHALRNGQNLGAILFNLDSPRMSKMYFGPPTPQCAQVLALDATVFKTLLSRFPSQTWWSGQADRTKNVTLFRLAIVLQIVGTAFNDAGNRDGHFYETIYSLLDSVSPEYRQTFGDVLMDKLKKLQKEGGGTDWRRQKERWVELFIACAASIGHMEQLGPPGDVISSVSFCTSAVFLTKTHLACDSFFHSRTHVENFDFSTSSEKKTSMDVAVIWGESPMTSKCEFWNYWEPPPPLQITPKCTEIHKNENIQHSCTELYTNEPNSIPNIHFGLFYKIPNLHPNFDPTHEQGRNFWKAKNKYCHSNTQPMCNILSKCRYSFHQIFVLSETQTNLCNQDPDFCILKFEPFYLEPKH